jgi:hypothetical protein
MGCATVILKALNGIPEIRTTGEMKTFQVEKICYPELLEEE